MKTRNWFSRLVQKLTGGSRTVTKKPRNYFRPAVEGMEDRVVPASLELASLVNPALISDTAGGESTPLATSADGRFVVFSSNAQNLVSGFVDNNGGDSDLFVLDRATETVRLVSGVQGSATVGGNNNSDRAVISLDGRYIAFGSASTNLVAGQVDGNGGSDVFVFDLASGTTRLVSGVNGSASTTANNSSDLPEISATGQYIAFRSHATNLVSNQTDNNGESDIFLFNLSTGTSQLVSHTAGSLTTTTAGGADGASISADGRFVAFNSFGTTHVTGQVDTNGTSDVFLFDRTTGNIQLVSSQSGSTTTTSDGGSAEPIISADGNFVAYTSSSNNVVASQDDNNGGNRDVFVFDRVAGTNRLVSGVQGSATDTGNASSVNTVNGLAISANGQFIVFNSDSTDLVAGQLDVNGTTDVFVFDRVAGTTRLVSGVNGSTTVTSAGGSSEVAISADGRYIAFDSSGTNVVAGQVDGNGSLDVFLFDRVNGATQLVSRQAGSTTTTGNRSASDPILSADGHFVFYSSFSTNLVSSTRDGNLGPDAFAFNRVTGVNTLVSRRHPSVPNLAAGVDEDTEIVVSDDGRFVVFASAALNVVAGQSDTNNSVDLFVYDRLLKTTRLVSGVQGSTTQTGSGMVDEFSISADGRYIAFESSSTNLVAGQADSNGTTDLFVFDRVLGTTRLVSGVNGSTTVTANGAVLDHDMSDDGQFIAFGSTSTNQVAGQSDSPGGLDIFLFDRVAGTTRLVSGTFGSTTAASDQGIVGVTISGDGSAVVFQSFATNLVVGQSDTNSALDVFAFDRVSGTLQLVSGVNGSTTTTANARSSDPVVSDNGRFIVFTSLATNVVSSQADVNGQTDVFVYDRVLGTTRLVSGVNGSTTTTGALTSDLPTISADGQYIAFVSASNNLVTGQTDTNGGSDVFLFDRVNGTMVLVSHTASSTTTAGNGGSTDPVISADGRFVAYESNATNLFSGFVNTSAAPDVFVYDRTTAASRLVSGVNASATTPGNDDSTLGAISDDGTIIAFLSDASNLVAGDFNSNADVFLFSNNTPFGTISDDTPTFDWAAVSGAASYEIVVVENATGEVVLRANAGDTTFTATAGLNPGASYTWYVGAIASNGTITYDAGQQFTIAPLSAPVQISPIGLIPATAGYDKPTFTWTAVAGADHYHLFVVDTTTGEAVIDNRFITSTSFTATSGLTPGHSFIWYVSAVSTNSEVEVYDAAGKTFSLAALPAPVQLSPSGNVAAAAGYDRPTFSWTPVPSADHYHLFVVDTTTGDAVIDDRNVFGTSYTPNVTQALTPGHSFIWYVSAVSSDGEAESYNADGMTFTLASLAEPVQVGPSGQIAASPGYDRPTFSWNAVTGAHHYYLFVMDTTTNQAVINEPNVVGTSYTPTTGLAAGHSYVWYVGAISTNGEAASYDPDGMTFTLAPLAAPTQNGPSGAISAAPGYDRPTFSWNPVVGADHYHLFVVDTTTGQGVIDNRNIAGTSFTPSVSQALTPGHSFIWYVSAVSADGQTESYNPAGVTFNLAPLTAPNQITPTGMTSDTTPTFTWSAVTGADHYHLFVIDDETGEAVINESNLSGTTFTPSTPLPFNRRYRWYLGAISTNGQVNAFNPDGVVFNIVLL